MKIFTVTEITERDVTLWVKCFKSLDEALEAIKIESESYIDDDDDDENWPEVDTSTHQVELNPFGTTWFYIRPAEL